MRGRGKAKVPSPFNKVFSLKGQRGKKKKKSGLKTQTGQKQEANRQSDKTDFKNQT